MDVLLSILVCFLTVYGAFQILYNISLRLSEPDKVKLGCCHRVVIVNNENDDIEAYVRSLKTTLLNDEYVILVDCFISESVSALLTKIDADFNYVNVMSFEEYTNYLNGLV